MTWVSPHILSFILNNKYKTPLHNYLIPLNALATLLVRASLCRRIVTTIFIPFFSDYNHTEPDYNHTEPDYNHTEPVPLLKLDFNHTEPLLLLKPKKEVS